MLACTCTDIIVMTGMSPRFRRYLYLSNPTQIGQVIKILILSRTDGPTDRGQKHNIYKIAMLLYVWNLHFLNLKLNENLYFNVSLFSSNESSTAIVGNNDSTRGRHAETSLTEYTRIRGKVTAVEHFSFVSLNQSGGRAAGAWAPYHSVLRITTSRSGIP